MKIRNSQLKKMILEELHAVLSEQQPDLSMDAWRERQRGVEQRASQIHGYSPTGPITTRRVVDPRTGLTYDPDAPEVIGHTAVHRGEAEDVVDTTPEFIKRAGEALLARTGEGTLGGDIVAGMEDLGLYGGPVGGAIEKYVVTPYLREPVEAIGASLAPQNIDWKAQEQERQAERRRNLRGFDFDFDLGDDRVSYMGDPMVPVDPSTRRTTQAADLPSWARQPAARPQPTPAVQLPQVDTSRLATDPNLVRFYDDRPGEAENRAARFAVRSGQIPASSIRENYLSINKIIDQEIDKILNEGEHNEN